jgi:hypothetical protein
MSKYPVGGFDVEENKEKSYIKSHTEMVSHCWVCALKRRAAGDLRRKEKKYYKKKDTRRYTSSKNAFFGK